MTNETAMLMALRSGSKINPKFQPQNNKQAYLAYLCGLDIDLPEPRTTEEFLLYKLCADGGKYLHTMTIRTYLGKITMTLKNNSAESLTGVYKESTDIFNGATLMIPAVDIGQDEDFYATVIGYEGGDIGFLVIDKDFPFPVIGSMPNVIEVMLGEVIDTITTKDGGKIEQEKKVEITKNGVTEIFPDEGYALSKVTAVVNVPTSTASKLPQIIDGTVTELTAEDLAGATKIRTSMFNGYTSLTSIIIPDSVMSIGTYAFKDCSNLANSIIGNGVTSIGKGAFQQCAKLTNITIGNSVSSIDEYAFYYCSSLTSVTMPDSVMSIGAQAFFNCSKLTSINIPDGVNIISNSVFGSCSKLTSINIPDSVTSIEEGAFRYCGLTSVTIPNGVTSIGNSAFQSCGNLTSVTIGNGVTSIGNSAFQQCRSLTSVTIGNGVTSIGNYTFEHCDSLTSVTIPDSVTSIGTYAFRIGKTDNKSTITFLGTTPPTVASNPFVASHLEKIIVPKGCGEVYKTATNWANFADYIEEATE